MFGIYCVCQRYNPRVVRSADAPLQQTNDKGCLTRPEDNHCKLHSQLSEGLLRNAAQLAYKLGYSQARLGKADESLYRPGPGHPEKEVARQGRLSVERLVAGMQAVFDN